MPNLPYHKLKILTEKQLEGNYACLDVDKYPLPKPVDLLGGRTEILITQAYQYQQMLLDEQHQYR